MRKQIQTFTLMFGWQVLDFVLFVVNFRAIAHLQYTSAALSDGVMCISGWTFFKQMQKEVDNPVARLAFVLGGIAGSLLGMYLTRVWGE